MRWIPYWKTIPQCQPPCPPTHTHTHTAATPYHDAPLVVPVRLQPPLQRALAVLKVLQQQQLLEERDVLQVGPLHLAVQLQLLVAQQAQLAVEPGPGLRHLGTRERGKWSMLYG